MPFRRASALVPGIDIPALTMAALRDQVHEAAEGLSAGPRIMAFGCDFGADVTRLNDGRAVGLSLPCIGMLPPSFIDYVLSRNVADGVLLTGCAKGACRHRFGIAWTEARLAGERDPHLRARVPRERLATCWLGRSQGRELERALAEFAARLEGLVSPKAETPIPQPQQETVGHG